MVARRGRRSVAAHAGGAVVVLHTAPGTTLATGAVVADLHGADLPACAVLNALVTGNERTFGQDPLLAFRLLADVALRALSPAVNDPATAVQALDCLEELLTGAAAAQTDHPLQMAGPGAPSGCWSNYRPGRTTCTSPWTT